MERASYAKLARSKTFRNREQAAEWADVEKTKYEQQGYSVRKEIDYDDKTNRWSAKIFIKSSGARSVGNPGEPRQ